MSISTCHCDVIRVATIAAVLCLDWHANLANIGQGYPVLWLNFGGCTVLAVFL